MKKLTTILLVAIALASCQNNSKNSEPVVEAQTDTAEVAQVEEEAKEEDGLKYYTCTKSKVDAIYEKVDSIFSLMKSYNISELGIGSDELNAELDDKYGSVAQLITAFYKSYDEITCNQKDPNVFFVWQEAAKKHIGSHVPESAGISKEAQCKAFFQMVDQVMDKYANNGPQCDMNAASYRTAISREYLLIDAYKEAIDMYPEVAPFAQADFRYLKDLYEKFCAAKSQDGYYSMLPLLLNSQLGSTYNAKAAAVRSLLGKNADVDAVKQNLTKHICEEDGRSYTLDMQALEKRFDN